MCYICDGHTQEQLLEQMHGHIGSGRWALQGVEGGERAPSWIYTVGLTHNFDHPELVIADVHPEQDGGLLNELGDRISRGLRVDASSTVEVFDGYVVEFEVVLECYLAAGLCASWQNYTSWLGARPGRLEVLQVVLPLSEWCDEHSGQRRRCLSVPGTPGFGDHRNRAARRAQSRLRRR
jgi:hypothetical protein